MSVTEALVYSLITLVVAWALETLLNVIYRQFCVRRLYFMAFEEALDNGSDDQIAARVKTPSLSKFR